MFQNLLTAAVSPCQPLGRLNGRMRAEDEFDALDDVDDEDFLD